MKVPAITNKPTEIKIAELADWRFIKRVLVNYKATALKQDGEIFLWQ